MGKTDLKPLGAALPVPARPRESCSSPSLCCPVWGVRQPLLAQLRRPRAQGREESHGGCWVVAQAKSAGQKGAELWLERAVRRQDVLLCLEGGHEEQ